MYLNILVFLISIIATSISMPMVYGMLINSNCTSLNYNKEKIPISMGLVFVLIQTIIVFSVSTYTHKNIVINLTYILAMILIGLIGLIDDLVGENDVKGFKGHIRALFKGKLTTGGLKAIIGFIAATLISIIVSESYIDFMVNVILIALFTNIINLFDLRPGRAGKVFVFIAIILLITTRNSEASIILFSAIGIMTIYMKYDLKAKVMMGDIGSNTLGITLGAFCANTQPLNIKIIYLLILVALHLVSEFYSFSKIITKNKLLNYLDRLGR